MRLKWTTRAALASTFGLSWAVAETILHQQDNAVRYAWRGPGRWLALACIASLLWGTVGARWLFPDLPHGLRALVELPGLVVFVLAWWICPRLLAHDAIRAAAEKARGDRSFDVSGNHVGQATPHDRRRDTP